MNDKPRRVEPEKTTEQYDFANTVTKAKVTFGVYDDRTNSVNQIVRARLEADGVEHGYLMYIRPFDELTIGQCVDISLRRLMEAKLM